MNKLLLVLVLVVVLGAGYYMMKGNSSVTQVSTTPEATVSGATGAEASMSAAKEFTVDGFEMGFSLKTITVKKGDTVKVTLTNSGKMPHDWIVDEFTGAKTKMIKNGETDTVTFVADKAGEFEYYCSVGSHRKLGMVGKLIVE